MGSVIVGIIVAAIIAAIVLSMRSDRKKGKHCLLYTSPSPRDAY